MALKDYDTLEEAQQNRNWNEDIIFNGFNKKFINVQRKEKKFTNN